MTNLSTTKIRQQQKNSAMVNIEFPITIIIIIILLWILICCKILPIIFCHDVINFEMSTTKNELKWIYFSIILIHISKDKSHHLHTCFSGNQSETCNDITVLIIILLSTQK